VKAQRDAYIKETVRHVGAEHVTPFCDQMEFPFEWQPRIVSTQLAFVGSIAIACVPGEFTTMAGRRLRDAITDKVARLGGPSISQVIVAGLCNTYSDYITTPEEYEVEIGSVLLYCRTVCP
jgi:neutral ceramidase